MSILGWLRPSRTVPVTRWRAPSRWSPTRSSLVALLLGLTVFGLGESLLVQAGLGVSPWTVLAQGLSVHLSMAIGTATFLVGVVVLLLWIPLRERPGLGTLLNIVVISAALEAGVRVVPAAGSLPTQMALLLAGIALVGIGSGFYLTASLGPGPRDGWMTGLHRATGLPVARVRLAIEVVVLGVGWLLGGTVGVGTVAFALLIGPAVAQGLAIAGRLGRVPGSADLDDDEFPELDA